MAVQKVGFCTPQTVPKLTVLLIFSVSILVSCTGLKPSRFPVKLLTYPEAILRIVESRQNKIMDLKGIAAVRVTDANKDHHLREAIIVRRPSSLRMETLSFFGQPLFFLIANDNRLSILSLAENRLYRGEVTPENLSLIFPFYLRPKDLFCILMGGIPLIDHVDADMTFLRKENLYLVSLIQEGGVAKQLLRVEPLNLSILESETYNSSGDLIFKVKFDKYERVNGLLFPMSTRIMLPLSSTTIRINYGELEINTGISQDNFNLDVPPGVKIVNLD